jgi:hypothetical protein
MLGGYRNRKLVLLRLLPQLQAVATEKKVETASLSEASSVIAYSLIAYREPPRNLQYDQ